MIALAWPDLAAFAWFAGAWVIYSIVIEKTAKGRTSLNALMNAYRDEWMEQLLVRNMRMVDAQVTAALQNGTAFFASTSLIAIGGALTLLRSGDEIMTVMSLLPLGATPSHGLWDLKMMGLIIIFVIRVLQICLVLSTVQLFCDHGWRRAAAKRKRYGRRAGLCTSRRETLRRRRPSFQSRPTRVLFCSGLPRVVSRPPAARNHHDRSRDRDVAQAVRLRRAQGLRSGARAPRRQSDQAIPIKTAIAATIITPSDVARMVISCSLRLTCRPTS